MKKVFTLLTLLLCAVVGVNAKVYATYTLTLNNGATQSPSGSFFTVSTGGGFNAKYTGTYNGTSFTKGLKLNSSSSITFSTSVKSNITIVQSTSSNGTNQFKLGGQAVAHTATGATVTIGGTAVSYTMNENTTDKYKEFVFTDVPATSNLALTNGGETGIFVVKVELTEDPDAFTQLSTPTISFDAGSGDVTISDVANATKITYTTDGSTPTASSDEYTAPFTVADGTTVKAIAIGSGSYTNSEIATKTVYLTGFTVATPVVNQFNGTVAITCATPNATIEYSTDGGSNWTTYSRAFTLTANTDIKARASRESCTTSDVTEATITAVAANLKSKTLVLGYGAFEGSGKVLTGKTTDIANGYTLTLVTDQDKSWSGRNKITISEISEERTTFCGSNGVKCQLDIPAGVKATQLRLYSYVNSATSTTNCAWKEVNGENLNGTLSTVPMGAFSDVADYQTNPDVRVFPLDNVEGSITFTNGGLQTCFVMVLDIIEPDVVVTPTKEYTTFCSTTPLDFTNVEGLEAYVVSTSNATTATLTKVNKVPAGTGLILKKTDTSANYNVPAATSTDTFTNLLVGVTADTELVADQAYVLSNGTFVKAAAGTLSAGKAYLPASEVSGARSLSLVFEGETTGINAIENAETINGIYNLNGQRVAQPTRGLYIMNGKKIIVK